MSDQVGCYYDFQDRLTIDQREPNKRNARYNHIIMLLYLCSAHIVDKGFTADLLSKLMTIT